jgi:hypothetical protein
MPTRRTIPDRFSEAETKRRFEATLRGALNTPPKPLKDISPKRAKPQQRTVGKGRVRVGKAKS